MEDIYNKAAMDELISRYPKQFRAIHRSDWPQGWHHLVERATKEIAEHYPTVYWAQVKEKYGTFACTLKTFRSACGQTSMPK